METHLVPYDWSQCTIPVATPEDGVRLATELASVGLTAQYISDLRQVTITKNVVNPTQQEIANECLVEIVSRLRDSTSIVFEEAVFTPHC